jgi:microsomal dipeptidase-like Zn-dependent dipeptidase
VTLLLAFLVASGAGPATARAAPKARFPLANGCAKLAGAIYFKPTGLGTTMLYTRARKLLAVGDGDTVERTATPGPSAEWATLRTGRHRWRLRSTENGRQLARTKGGALTTVPAGSRPAFRLRRTRGCRRYPEAAVGAKGTVFRGRIGRNVFGYADAHLHVMAELRAGGQVISGGAFDRFGVTEALGRDADVHGPDGGLDVTGNLLRSGNPAGTHDTDGWPTFKGWPTFDTYTHQQVYYTWLKRSYAAGLRLVTAQLVEDEPLCNLERPRVSHSCDETETIALEAARLRELEAYVDAQSGGRGRGWFRIVTSSRQARRAIERGKLAVLMGVESSSPFGCSESMGQPQCDRDDIDRGIALYRKLGIRSTFIAHWIDNAFGGAALEEGDKGDFIAAFELSSTGHPFATGPCPQPEQGESCNAKGLTDLGEYLVGRLMDNHMLIEMDHLSEVAREKVLAIAEKRDYPLVSSHTNTGGFWTESDLRRLYAIGGFATARPDTAAKLAKSILRFRKYRQKGQFFGVGLGTDTGGFAAMPEPDPAAQQRPLRYPFRSYDRRVVFVCQVAGERKYDINKDGVTNYGMYADLLAYMRAQTGGQDASRLLFRSAEAYLRTWRRAETRG